ncbi:hypothetical protein HPB51_004254 [Rhipicephalus microplus]|uniref:Cytosolic endo-beta-N-acetylglucosaminidase TIM barrel domain-containing protein n=1 Tax=Rhipicephalus microplus TaxID=6941 RepID=A0A9J6ERE4_RHIMP|nr:hypothetical protein HPB51_004254 [Rhipicephalus microplus]
MAVSMSQNKRGLARVVKGAPEDEVAPLKTLEELLGYKMEPLLCAVEPLSAAIKRGKPGDPRTIFCHDMDGNYKEDREAFYGHDGRKHRGPSVSAEAPPVHPTSAEDVEGGEEVKLFCFLTSLISSLSLLAYGTNRPAVIPVADFALATLEWQLVTRSYTLTCTDTGTFILGKDGTKALNTIRFSGLTSQVAVQLANVARVGRFDGWLISIGCKMDPSCISFLENLLSSITEETHKAVPGSLVIWYDAVDVDGNAKPHNELNEKNACFFDLCDGIFLDFRWTEDMLLNSARVAGDRKADVYAGVDVYARETWYSGGYDMYKAVQLAHRCGLSAAVFAAGWVYETQDEKNFAANQRRLWALPEDCRSQCKVTALPLSTTFCQGCGTRLYNQGRVVKPAPWFDLSKQQLQPRDQGTNLCGSGGSAILSTATSYTGGGCLYLHYSPEKAPGSTLIPYFKLFGFDLPLGSLCVSYAFKNKQQGSLAGHDVNLILRVRDVGGKEDELSLGSVIVVPQSEKYIVEREITDSAQGDLSLAQGGWLTRKYYVKDATGSALLEEIGISFNANEEIACYLGELVVKRPEITSEREAAGDPKDCGQHDQAEEGLESITFEYSMSSDESD